MAGCRGFKLMEINVATAVFQAIRFFFLCCKLSNVQNPVDIPLYWLVDRDPYNGL